MDPLANMGGYPWIFAAAAFFLFIVYEGSAAIRVSFGCIAAILSLLAVASFFSRQNPYSGAAKKFGEAELARVRTAMQRRLESSLQLSPRDFEIAVGRLFEAEGWIVEVTRSVADGGKDLILQRFGRRVFVEVKQYNGQRKVGRPALMKLHSAVVHECADGGIFVTTSSFTEPAREFAEKNWIKLIDSSELAARLLTAFPENEPTVVRSMCRKCSEVSDYPDLRLPSQKCSCGAEVESPLPLEVRHYSSVNCVTCGLTMVRRRIKGTRYYSFKCPSCSRSPAS